MPEAALERDIVHDDENHRFSKDRDRFLSASSASQRPSTQKLKKNHSVLSSPSSPEQSFIRPTSNLRLHLSCQDDRNLRDDHPRVQAALLQSRDLGGRRADFGL